MVGFLFVIIFVVASFIAGMIFKDLIVGYFVKFLNKIKSLFVKGE
jgi:uncharacterized membrane protein YraQ (UPF0718 family)